jgi:hypothetical protein
MLWLVRLILTNLLQLVWIHVCISEFGVQCETAKCSCVNDSMSWALVLLF